MKLRIAMWACAGALVAVFWGLYISATFPNPLGNASVLIYLSCPISLVRHSPINFYSVVLVNAATYALAGALVEVVRGHRWRRA